MQPVPSYVSLFSGCGGLDLAFIEAGYQCLAAYDIDPTSVATYNQNLHPYCATIADLRNVHPHSMPTEPDVIVAGPPCQGFSTVGRRDLADYRNGLLLTSVHIAIATKAKAVVIENVPGALSGAHARYWTQATATLEHHGYNTATIMLHATTVGLPQLRRRAVLVAARNAFNAIPPIATSLPLPLRSVLSIPAGIANHQPCPLPPSSRSGRIASRIRPGQKLSNVRRGLASVHTWDIPDVFGPGILDRTPPPRNYPYPTP